jgi:hypothetical protein
MSVSRDTGTPNARPYTDDESEAYALQNERTLWFGNSEAEPLLLDCDYLLAACVDFSVGRFPATTFQRKS